MTIWERLRSLGRKAKRATEKKATAEARREPVSVAAVMTSTREPAEKRAKQAAQQEHVHKYRQTPSGKKCDDCGHEPHLDRRVTVPVVVGSFDANGRPTLVEVFPDGTRIEANANSPREFLSRWIRRRG